MCSELQTEHDCAKRKIVGGQRCCTIDDCGRPKAAWGVGAGGGRLSSLPPRRFSGITQENVWKFIMQNLAFWHISDGVFKILDSWNNSAEITRPTIRLPTCWHSPVWVIRPFSNTKYVRSTLGLLLLTDRATTSAPTIRRSNVYVWSVNKNI